MLAAGFSGEPSYLKQKALDLLANPLIQEAIKERSKYMADTLKIVADRRERQALWTSIMRNEDPHYIQEKDANGIPIPETNINLQHRLKAAELLGKSEGDFIDNVNINANLSISDLILKSYKDDTPIEDIEAEYERVKSPEQIEAPILTPTLSSFI